MTSQYQHLSDNVHYVMLKMGSVPSRWSIPYTAYRRVAETTSNKGHFQPTSLL